MKLTSQEEYGLRCLLQIASAPERFLTIPEVARREVLSTAYVAKLMRILRRAGFVRSVRGQKGGFELGLPPQEINVGMVLGALGGRLYSEAFCGDHAGDNGVCVHKVDCSIRTLWTALDSAIQNVLLRTQLSHLISGEGHLADHLQSQANVWLRRNLQAGIRTRLQDATTSVNPVALSKGPSGEN